MLSKIRLQNRAYEYVDFAFSPGVGSGYRGLQVDGLSSGKASVNHSKYARLPGGIFQSIDIDARNIVIKAAYLPNYKAGATPETLRRKIMHDFPDGSWVKLRIFEDDVETRYIEGYVESKDPLFFAKEPSISISIICVNPMFVSSEEKSYYLTSGISNKVPYDGNVVGGYVIKYRTSGVTSLVSLKNDRGGELWINRSYPTAFYFIIDTRPGSKGVWNTDSNYNKLSSILGSVEVRNGWPNLQKGDNMIRLESNSGAFASASVVYQDVYDYGV